MKKREQKKNVFMNEKVMLCVVAFNVIIIFLQECGLDNVVIRGLDILCTAIFVVEMIVKQCVLGFKDYWKNGWNIMDGVVTIITLPSLLVYFIPAMAGMKVVVALRALRVFKSFRMAKHFPKIDVIWGQFRVAMKQSVGFLVGFFLVIVVVAMLNSALFCDAAPEYFKTPLDAIYAVFQLFTVEGWYEIPNAVAENMGMAWTYIIRIYFCMLLIGGGIIGMSLINSIFVDALAADNNDDVKEKLAQMESQMVENQKKMEEQINELKQLLRDNKQ